jgi:ribonucleotide reductase beta subunit family protein with ferritin-like domain
MPIVLFTKASESCTHCENARALLYKHGVTVDDVPCGTLQEARDKAAEIVGSSNMTHVNTFPIVVDTETGRLLPGGYRGLRDRFEEPLLQRTEDRFTLFPITAPDIYDLYKAAIGTFWTVEEITLLQDQEDWRHLTVGEQHFLERILAFFAASDAIVSENLAARFCNEITLPEARAFYAYQIFNESIHAEMYGLLIDSFITDPHKRDTLLHGMSEIDSIRRKARWALQWLDENRPFAERLVAFACVEGILFSASFCAIFWVKNKRGLMPGLSLSNQFICRDEYLHQLHAVALYRRLVHKLSQDEIEQIVFSAVAVEEAFVEDALQVDLIGMNKALMKEYVQFVANRLVVQLGYAPIFRKAENPFKFMEQLALTGTSKTNFFEARVSEYCKASIVGGTQDLVLVDDF